MIINNPHTIENFSTKYIKSQTVKLKFDKYVYQNRTHLSLLSLQGEPLAIASVNLPDIDLEELEKEKNCKLILIKDYSENEGILKALEKAKVVKDLGIRIASGFVTIPVCELLIKE